MQNSCPSRRHFLKVAGSVVPALALPASAFTADREPHQLCFYHQHTREKLDIVYRDSGAYLPDALEQISYLLRDFRSGEIYPIDPSLLDYLHAVKARTGSQSEFEIISGFRSPATNAMLRNLTDGVAKRSLHMQGKAIDVRMNDVPTASLRKAALNLRRGGVGHYPQSDFVHLDTGRFRSW